MNTRRILAALAAGAVLLTASVVTPAQAAAPNDAVIRNSADSNAIMNICKDFGSTTCATASPQGTLYPGQNSKTKYGWADTDAVYLPAGCNLYYAGSVVRDGPRWVKISGTFGVTTDAKLVC